MELFFFLLFFSSVVALVLVGYLSHIVLLRYDFITNLASSSALFFYSTTSECEQAYRCSRIN
eukprot:m.392952 g.392952  ORF g.392952 m.392952 type:complete len:62 (-) comp237602_c0_seq1:8-193(-)